MVKICSQVLEKTNKRPHNFRESVRLSSPSDQSERIEQRVSLGTLQDGRSVSVERHASARRLYVQNRFKRHIFCGSIVKKPSEICQVPDERHLCSKGPYNTSKFWE